MQAYLKIHTLKPKPWFQISLGRAQGYGLQLTVLQEDNLTSIFVTTKEKDNKKKEMVFSLSWKIFKNINLDYFCFRFKRKENVIQTFFLWYHITTINTYKIISNISWVNFFQWR